MPCETFLLLMLDVEAGDDDVLNAWYDLEHIPQMLAIPGCRSAERYRAAHDRPRYLATYGLDHIDVLASEAAQQVRPQHPLATPWSRWMMTRFRNFRRGVYDVLGETPGDDGRSLTLVGYAAERFDVDGFRRWYDDAVVPWLAEQPDRPGSRCTHISPASSNALDAPGHYLLLIESDRDTALRAEEGPLAAARPAFTGVYGNPGRVELPA